VNPNLPDPEPGNIFSDGKLPDVVKGPRGPDERLKRVNDIANHVATISIFNIATEDHKPEAHFFPAHLDWQLIVEGVIGSSIMVGFGPKGFWLGHLWETPGFANAETGRATSQRGSKTHTEQDKSDELFRTAAGYFATSARPPSGKGWPITVKNKNGRYLMEGASIKFIGVGAQAAGFQDDYRPTTGGEASAGPPRYVSRYKWINDEVKKELKTEALRSWAYKRPNPPGPDRSLKLVRMTFELSGVRLDPETGAISRDPETGAVIGGDFRVIVEDQRGAHVVINEKLLPSEQPRPEESAGPA